MDIKDLNKSQLILLAVLLSFVTSIATGITTVTLMQQAPSSITTPVSRIVKQTIEKIEQVEGKTTVNTVVIKEEDLVVEAIAVNKPHAFAVTKEILDVEGKTIEVSAGRGFVVSSSGDIVVDAGQVGGSGVYYLENENGKWKASFSSKKKEGFSFLKIGDNLDKENKTLLTAPTLGDISKMRVGQRMVILGAGISFVIIEDSKNINTSVAKKEAGAMVLNLDGDVLGMALSGSTESFVSIKTIQSALESEKNESEEKDNTTEAS